MINSTKSKYFKWENMRDIWGKMNHHQTISMTNYIIYKYIKIKLMKSIRRLAMANPSPKITKATKAKELVVLLLPISDKTKPINGNISHFDRFFFINEKWKDNDSLTYKRNAIWVFMNHKYIVCCCCLISSKWEQMYGTKKKKYLKQNKNCINDIINIVC